jgi:16S rRNA (cytidine1402-2'-O)-methyltransferase
VSNEVVQKGRLVVVATPIGNLGDLSARAEQCLGEADVILCEDTRHTRVLLSARGIKGGGRLVALHQHNEASQVAEVVNRVLSGQLVALVSDAGTPGISDPGSRVVSAVASAGGVVSTIPGPSAVIAALSVSGLDTERFVMEGFVPRRAGERRARFDQWAREPRTIVFYESPQRIAETLSELAERFPDRRLALARELTKFYEEVRRGTVAELAEALRGSTTLGEVVVVLEGAPEALVESSTVEGALRELLASGTSIRDAVTELSQDLGVGHRELYQLALALRDRGSDSLH